MKSHRWNISSERSLIFLFLNNYSLFYTDVAYQYYGTGHLKTNRDIVEISCDKQIIGNITSYRNIYCPFTKHETFKL